MSEREGYEVHTRAVDGVVRDIVGQIGEYGKLLADFEAIPMKAGFAPVAMAAATAASTLQKLLHEAQQNVRGFLDATNHEVGKSMAGYRQADETGTQDLDSVARRLGVGAVTGARTLAGFVHELKAAGYSPEQIHQGFANQGYQVRAGMAVVFDGDLAGARLQPGDAVTTPTGTYVVDASGRPPDGIPPGTQGRVYRSMTAGLSGQGGSPGAGGGQ